MPGIAAEKLALGLALTTGLMGIISPYATGAALPYTVAADALPAGRAGRPAGDRRLLDALSAHDGGG